MSTLPLPLLLPPHGSKGTTVMILMIIIALGVVVSYNWLITIQQTAASESRLPMQGRVETDLPAWVDQNGVTRHLEELKGKVFAVAYLYTTCPQGCAGVAGEMDKLQKEFGK